MRFEKFNKSQIVEVKKSVEAAEELVSDYYHMTASQWLKNRYDVFTVQDLEETEIIKGPFAQVVRYQGNRIGKELNSASFDYYKICLMDHSIIRAIGKGSRMEEGKQMQFFPFLLYIISHELIHIIRFGRFMQSFYADSGDMNKEEILVHKMTREILQTTKIKGLSDVFQFYEKWFQ
jgi:hypothetical protein